MRSWSIAPDPQLAEDLGYTGVTTATVAPPFVTRFDPRSISVSEPVWQVRPNLDVFVAG
jgi:hypothetical protein